MSKMEIKITEDKKQPLFGRRRVVAEVIFGEGKTPSRAEVKAELSKQLKADGKLLSVRKIETGYGVRRANVEVYVYPSEAELLRLEPRYIKERELPKEKKEAAAAAEKKGG